MLQLCSVCITSFFMQQGILKSYIASAHVLLIPSITMGSVNSDGAVAGWFKYTCIEHDSGRNARLLKLMLLWHAFLSELHR
jgi:hypothetical protein